MTPCLLWLLFCAQVLAAATRFYDIGSSISSSLLPPGTRPSSCTLALLLNSAAATGDADLVMGAWRYLGSSSTHQQQQQQHEGAGDDPQSTRNSAVEDVHVESSSSSFSSQPLKPSSSSGSRGGQHGLSARGVLPEQNVLHALVFGSIMCDLAGSGITAGSSRRSTHCYGFTAGPVVAAVATAAATAGNATSFPGAAGVSHVIFHQDSATTEALRELQASMMQHWQQQEQQQRWRRRHRQQRPQLPVALLHPNQAAALLQLTTSAADTDILLLSQLYQPGGLTIEDAIQLAQQQQQQQQQRTYLAQQQAQPGQLCGLGGTSWLGSTDGGSHAHLASSQHPLALLSFKIKPEVVPMFPPPLRSDVARAAVAAYARHGAFARAAAVAHAAAVANPKDGQQYQLLIRSCAAAGNVMPALVTMSKMRERLWQTAAPRAQAAVLR
jgi:hypothetical protein